MKKIIGLFAAAFVVAMILSACTPSGMPTSLVGVWKSETKRVTNLTTGDTTTDVSYVEFTDDDYYLSGDTKDELSERKKEKKDCSKIIKATCNELHVKSGSVVSDNSYSIMKYELAGDKLTLERSPGYKMVYAKD
ncbi:MAG: hypothetical protein J6Y01_00405 [Spirochaetales bacterium]|nr:hypothetical protein [Spirochaetales bacterium]